VAGDWLSAAREAFARGEWAEARDRFSDALDERPSADALDGLGQALWWLGETQAAIEHRSRAFAEYRREGQDERAANVAVYVAAEYRIAGNASVANGWLGRAERLLDGKGDCEARAWLEIERSKRAPNPAGEESHAREAMGIAQRLDSGALEAVALSHVGLARISAGDVDGGLAMLDEALSQATAAGEAEDPLAIGEACCVTLVACEQLADARRARDCSQVVSEFTRRRRYTPLSAWCGSVHAAFLVASGRWEEAERELGRSLAEYERLPETNRVAPLAVLADLRIRQGRIEEAGRLLAGCEDHPAALEPVAALLLARGEVELAAEKVDARLEALAGSPAHAAPVLALRAAVALARGDAPVAAAAAAELARIAAPLGREDLVARAAVHAAAADRLAGRRPSCPALEDAVATLRRLELPLDECVARVELARALASERRALAVEQAKAALAGFERLGAVRRADEAAALLREIGAPGRRAPRAGGTLTRRESEVLELLGAGLSNPEIAERLVISRKTVEHHVASVLMKLGMRNRAEAAVHAVRGGARPTA
jgi:DNA-binding CsgD family transcriptional regulator